jgi:hypothetical protein
VLRGRPTEVEYLNGEVVRLGKELDVPTPANELLMSLMQRTTSGRHHLTRKEVEESFLHLTLRNADGRKDEEHGIARFA